MHPPRLAKVVLIVVGMRVTEVATVTLTVMGKHVQLRTQPAKNQADIIRVNLTHYFFYTFKASQTRLDIYGNGVKLWLLSFAFSLTWSSAVADTATLFSSP